MNKTTIQSLFAAALVAAAVCAPAQSFLEVADATLDAVRESNEQAAAPENVRAVFAKAKEAVEDDDKLNLCGFYTGMSAADAKTLAEWYKLKDGEWSAVGDPVYEIKLTLKGVRRVTKGGNTLEELAQAVANRVGDLNRDWETKGYGRKTIDGISVTMSESTGFTMIDTEAKASAERKAREEREAALRKALEEREAAERREKESARHAALAWNGKSKTVQISDSVAIKLRSVPGNLWFGQFEVTQAQWEAVMDENPSKFKNPDNPVEHVSWDDCQEFLKKLNSLPSVKESGLTFRLPTEEEWERACRAGATGYFCQLADGTEITEETLGEVAWFWVDENSDMNAHPVGQKKPNAFGLYDMHGNVFEWTSTVKGNDRVVRGGAYGDPSSCCMANAQFWSSPSDRYYGLRLCADGKAD